MTFRQPRPRGPPKTPKFTNFAMSNFRLSAHAGGGATGRRLPPRPPTHHEHRSCRTPARDNERKIYHLFRRTKAGNGFLYGFDLRLLSFVPPRPSGAASFGACTGPRVVVIQRSRGGRTPLSCGQMRKKSRKKPKILYFSANMSVLDGNWTSQ